jgi:hypothetical protein
MLQCTPIQHKKEVLDLGPELWHQKCYWKASGERRIQSRYKNVVKVIVKFIRKET